MGETSSHGDHFLQNEELIAALLAYHEEHKIPLPKEFSQPQTDTSPQARDQEALKVKYQNAGATDQEITIGLPLIEKYSDNNTSEEQKMELMNKLRSFMALSGNVEQTERYIAALKGVTGLKKKTIEERKKLTPGEQFCEDWINSTIEKFAHQQSNSDETSVSHSRASDINQRMEIGTRFQVDKIIRRDIIPVISTYPQFKDSLKKLRNLVTSQFNHNTGVYSTENNETFRQEWNRLAREGDDKMKEAMLAIINNGDARRTAVSMPKITL